MIRKSLLARRRKLQFERCEPRQLMAAYINEIHFAPLFGAESEDQYIELRGDANQVLGAGTYFVAVGSSDGVNELGDVHSIFDLSGQQFGSNGLLVLMQAAGGYVVNSQARLLRGTDGFRGMGGGIFSADNTANKMRTGSNTFLLISSTTAPTLTMDIDGNDDGVPDGAYNNWTIQDSVAVLPWGESVWPQKTYSQFTFRERNVGSVMPGTTSVTTDQLAYVARIDRSTGYAADDWLAANTVEGTAWNFQIQHGTFGAPRPYAYGGRFLDHVGSENWTGAIAGTVYNDENGDGVRQPAEAGVPNVIVNLTKANDTNSDLDVDRIDPDAFPVNTDVSNASPYFSMVSAGANNVHQGFKIRVVQRAFSAVGDFIFAHEGVGFFNEDRRMRLDFYHPAVGVSIDVIGNSNTQATYGRLELFNAANQSLGFVRTGPLGSGQRERLSLSSNNNNVAWALAYPENSYLNSSPFGMLENLEVTVPEFSVLSDSSGNYSLPAVPNGTYTLFVTKPPTYDIVSPTGLGQHSVTVTGNNVFAGRNFGLQGNRPPQLGDQIYSVSELTDRGTRLATLPVTLGYPSQKLRYTITSGDVDGLFAIDDTGHLDLIKTGLDFETRPNIRLQLKLEDLADVSLNDTAIVELILDDGNEAPVVQGRSASIAENTANGTLISTMSALDPDAGLAGTFMWSISSGNTNNAFTVDSNTGIVTVLDSTKLDFEQLTSFTLVMRATDKGTPAQIGQATLFVTLTNVNESPVVLGQALSIRENSSSGSTVGTATVADPDANESFQWQIIGGSGASLFTIQPTSGRIELAPTASLDFEQTSSYTIDVKVSDSGTPALSGSRLLTISIQDENDAPSISGGTLSLDENSPVGTVLGSFTGTDEDQLQTLSYSLTGADAAAFVIDAAIGTIATRSGSLFDFETKASYVFDVVVTDSFTPAKSAEAKVTVSIKNVNEAPVLSSTSLALAENSSAGTDVGTLAAADQDAGDTLSWTLLTQTQDWLSLDAATGQVKVASGAVIDFEVHTQALMTVRVTDAAGLSSTGTITVNVSDRNDPPTLNKQLSSATAKAGQAFSYPIAADTFSDPDAGDNLNVFVTLASGFPLPGWLSYNASTRTLSGTPSTSDGATLNLNVTAIDQGGLSATAALTITVDTNLFPWNNPRAALDVTNDGLVTALDALLVINYINTTGPSPVPPAANPTNVYLDTNRDNSVSSIDVLLVINQLNQQVSR